MNTTEGNYKQTLGAWGEQKAAEFLISSGYHILERNYSSRKGEIDLIAAKQDELYGKILCFIEVKTRTGKPNGSAERAVSGKKIKHMKMGAISYCIQKKIDPEHQMIAFEQISVYQQKGNQVPQIRWYHLPSC